MAADKRPPDDDTDDAWIRLPGGEMSIRVRSLTNYLNKGGRLVHARLIEDTEGLYSVWMRLADRPGEFRLNQFDYDQPKTYKDVALAIATIRDDFGFYGTIALSTERRPAAHGG